MEQDGNRPPRMTAQSLPHDASVDAEVITRAIDDPTEPLDPMDFFRATDTHEAAASYTKLRALRTAPATFIATWARAANARTWLWALLPIFTAGAFLFAQQQRLYLNRLVILALAAMIVLSGLNLVLGVAHHVDARHPIGDLLQKSLPARVGIVLLAVGVAFALFAPRWIGPGNIGLGVLGLALAAIYLIISFTLGAVPGQEVLPAVALGPVLFFLALSTQLTPATTKGKQIVSVSHALSQSEWLVALALAGLLFAALVAARLAHPKATSERTTRAIIGERSMRALFLVGLLVAYICAIGAGLARGVPHATVAVLLSLPMAVLPLTTIMRARTSAALQVVYPQMQRTLLWFGVWLIGGLLLGGAYLHLLTALHAIITAK